MSLALDGTMRVPNLSNTPLPPTIEFIFTAGNYGVRLLLRPNWLVEI